MHHHHHHQGPPDQCTLARCVSCLIYIRDPIWNSYTFQYVAESAWGRMGTRRNRIYHSSGGASSKSQSQNHTHTLVWSKMHPHQRCLLCCTLGRKGEPESASNFALAAHSLSQISAEVAILGFREFTRPSPCPSGPLRSHVYTETHAKNRAQTWIMLLKLGRGRVWERS